MAALEEDIYQDLLTEPATNAQVRENTTDIKKLTRVVERLVRAVEKQDSAIQRILLEIYGGGSKL